MHPYSGWLSVLTYNSAMLAKQDFCYNILSDLCQFHSCWLISFIFLYISLWYSYFVSLALASQDPLTRRAIQHNWSIKFRIETRRLKRLAICIGNSQNIHNKLELNPRVTYLNIKVLHYGEFAPSELMYMNGVKWNVYSSGDPIQLMTVICWAVPRIQGHQEPCPHNTEFLGYAVPWIL